jgi:hypothetical protein
LVVVWASAAPPKPSATAKASVVLAKSLGMSKYLSE